MTSQVAITLLKNLEQSLDDYCELNNEGRTAFNMAITALEQFGNSEQLYTINSLPTVQSDMQEADIVEIMEQLRNTKVTILPSAEPEVKPISYIDCANAMLKMWIDGVLTDGEYNRIMDKLNMHWRKKDEFISRQDAINMLCSKCTVDKPETCSTIQKGDNWCEEVHTLLNMPSAEPEIIRCKDCKFARMTVDGECKYCDIWFPDEKTYMPGNYFCASAERRTNE